MISSERRGLQYYEAQLVVADRNITGFYLPVEKHLCGSQPIRISIQPANPAPAQPSIPIPAQPSTPLQSCRHEESPRSPSSCLHRPLYHRVRLRNPVQLGSGHIPPVGQDLGRVFFYRTSILGAAIQPDVKLNGEKVGSAKPKGFFYVDRPAGAYKGGDEHGGHPYAQFHLEKNQDKVCAVEHFNGFLRRPLSTRNWWTPPPRRRRLRPGKSGDAK